VDRLRVALTQTEDVDQRETNNAEVTNAVRLLYRMIPIAFEGWQLIELIVENKIVLLLLLLLLLLYV
jgi:hypothetical protein